MSSLSEPEVNARGRAIRHELEGEKEHRHALTQLLLWIPPGNYTILKDDMVQGWLEEWERTEIREMPMIIRKYITTARAKDKLLEICCSEKNLRDLQSLDWEFVEGRHEYTGSLNLFQQLSFLELFFREDIC